MDEAIASLNGNVPASIIFVSGGTFNLGKSGSEQDLVSQPSGGTIEYKIEARHMKHPPSIENRDFEASVASSSDITAGPMEIDTLMQEFKRNQGRREQVKTERKQTNKDSFVNSNLASVSTLKATSNIRLGNLSSHVTASMLNNEFSCYGPILSSKMMIPRLDEVRDRKTCGFVLFAHRSDAERAKLERDGSNFHGNPLVMDWAPAPDPQSLARMKNDLLSSLHFSSASHEALMLKESSSRTYSSFSKIIPRGSEVVYIVHTENKKTEKLAELVARDGLHIEDAIMQQERGNPDYGFLFDISSNDYLYYRWRLNALRQGEKSPQSKPFQLDPNGPYLIPPLPKHETLFSDANDSTSSSYMDFIPAHLAKDGIPLSEAERTHLEVEILHSITASRADIALAMQWIIEHEQNAPEIVQLLTESLTITETKLGLKLARLFLISDVLHNVRHLETVIPGEFPKLWLFTACFYTTLPVIMKSFGNKYKTIPGRISAQSFKDQVYKVLANWKKQNLYMPIYVEQLTQYFNDPNFLPPSTTSPPLNVPNNATPKPKSIEVSQNTDPTPKTAYPLVPHQPTEDDIDGTPISVYPENGLPIDFDALLKEEIEHVRKQALPLA
jgi:U2-associated protein SR140